MCLLAGLLITTPHTTHAAQHHAPVGKRGVVAADHVLASQAGLTILKRGGNAVDAACATAFAVGVVNPAGSGIGGGGFMMLHDPKANKRIIIDFRETAPAGASRLMYLKKGLPKHPSRTGGLAVGIPGEVKGCAYAVKRYGKLALAQVLQPAIELARRGFPAGRHFVEGLKRYQKHLSKHKTLKEIFYPGGKPPTLGQIFRRPRLAKTLQAIAKHGPDVFYKGWIAKDIVDAVKSAGGILTHKDLAQYKVAIRHPLKTSFRGHEIYTMPPPSSGGAAIIMALNILRKMKLKTLGHNSSTYLFHLTEALQHAFADRARFMGDHPFTRKLLPKLTSQKYADKLAKRITNKVQAPKAYGSQKRSPKASPKDGGTSHISVIDKDGMAVAMTTTINTGYGSKVIAPRSGIILNNEMDDFSTNPGKPNAFGLIQSQYNEITPGKRPLSSMSPTLITKGGKIALAVGASGGPTIITGTLQTLLNVLVFGLEINDAVSRSRIHHQWFPPLLFIESDLPADVVQALQKRGYKTRVWKVPFTAVQAAQRTKVGLTGASDPRKHGKTAVH